MTTVAPGPDEVLQPTDQSQQPDQSSVSYRQPATERYQSQNGAKAAAPVTKQPGFHRLYGNNRRERRPVVWMERPQLIPGCPTGLEYLTLVDQLCVEQEVDGFEMVTGWEKKNKYRINNSMGQQCYYAQEESDSCQRQWAGPGRGFTMHITDNAGQEIIRVTREFRYCTGNSCCANSDKCAFEVTVEAPVGNTVGYVRQLQYFCIPRFSIMDGSRQEILLADGPGYVCECICCAKEQEFIIRSPDGQHDVGKITKEYGGLAKEAFTDADKFVCSFPMDLDVKMKAVMIGAVLLIDFMFFESGQ